MEPQHVEGCRNVNALRGAALRHVNTIFTFT
jgi:hypothetical protein